MSMRRIVNVGLIGVGNIGGALAHSLLGVPGIALTLYDIRKNMAKGKLKDLEHAHIMANQDAPRLTLADSLRDIKACDIIVVLAGQARQPGMERSALLKTNADILAHISDELKGTEAVVIVVTNPVDAMTQWMYRRLDIPKQRILGMAGTLDEARFIRAVGKILKIPSTSLTGVVVGAHNHTMVPLVSSLTWGGMPLEPEHIDRLMIGEVLEQTRNGGAEIVQLLEQGSAYWGPAQAIKSLILAIAYNEKKVVRASVFIDKKDIGGVALQQICCGLPVELGQDGWTSIAPLSMTAAETVMFAHSVQSLQDEWLMVDELIREEEQGRLD